MLIKDDNERASSSQVLNLLRKMINEEKDVCISFHEDYNKKELDFLISQLDTLYNIGILSKGLNLNEDAKLIIKNAKCLIFYMDKKYNSLMHEDCESLKFAVTLNKKIIILTRQEIGLANIGYLNFCLNNIKLVELLTESTMNENSIDLVKFNIQTLLNQVSFLRGL